MYNMDIILHIIICKNNISIIAKNVLYIKRNVERIL